MQTRLPPALAALGVALFLSTIEAEGKKLFLSHFLTERYRILGRTKTDLSGPLVLAWISLHFMFFLFPFTDDFFLDKYLLLSSSHFPALKSSSFAFFAIHSVQCCVVYLSCLCGVLSTLPPPLSPSQRSHRLFERGQPRHTARLTHRITATGRQELLTMAHWSAWHVRGRCLGDSTNKRLPQRWLCVFLCTVRCAFS